MPLLKPEVKAFQVPGVVRRRVDGFLSSAPEGLPVYRAFYQDFLRVPTPFLASSVSRYAHNSPAVLAGTYMYTPIEEDSVAERVSRAFELDGKLREALFDFIDSATLTVPETGKSVERDAIKPKVQLCVLACYETERKPEWAERPFNRSFMKAPEDFWESDGIDPIIHVVSTDRGVWVEGVEKHFDDVAEGIKRELCITKGGEA